jgi:DNA primase
MQSNTHFYNWLIKRGITNEVLDLFNITVYNHPVIGDCIRIPYSDTHAKYRRDPNDPRKPKYLYDTGGKVTLYGFDVLHEAHPPGEVTPDKDWNPIIPPVVITEGELDTLVLWSQNIPAVSSTGGAMSFQEEWADQLKNYQVYLCFDNDDAGAKGMIKVLKYLPNASVILIPELPDIKDISDYVASGRSFRDLMQSALHNLTTTSIEEDMAYCRGRNLSTRFHQAYLDEQQQVLYKTTHTPSTYDGDDAVLKARAVPMTNYIDFRQRKACCPWHKENTPSLHYYPKTNSAYCFGSCGKAYDSIDAHKLKHSCSFKEAIKQMT